MKLAAVFVALCIEAGIAMWLGHQLGEHDAYAKVTSYSVEARCKGDRLK